MTTAILQTRSDWNALPPTAITRLNWSKVDKFIVHYSGATRTQSVRSIQQFCMFNKGHSDIDYNELVRGNLLYVGRGNNIGSHTLGNNSTSYGVCMIGLDGDATADDMNVIRSRYDYACAMAGRQLNRLGHNQAPGLPDGYTDCPGGQLQRWINQGMPYIQTKRTVDMFLLRDDSTGAIYMSSGATNRHMDASTQPTIDQLQNAGVPLLHYLNEAEVVAAGGPIVKDTRTVIVAPTTATLSFPPGSVTLA